MIFIPYSERLWQLYLYFVLIGLCAGTWNSTNNVWLIEMWQKNSGPILQLSQFTYGIGTIMGPLIDRSYLLGEREFDHFGGHHITDVGLNVTTIDTHNSTTIDDSLERRRLLKTPFLISGCLHLIGTSLNDHNFSNHISILLTVFRSVSFVDNVCDEEIQICAC